VSVAFETRSNNKKKGVKRGVLGGIEGGRKAEGKLPAPRVVES